MPPVETRFVSVACEGDIGDGELFGTDIGEVPVLLVRLDGRIRALGRICTHQYADLADGQLEDGCVVCPLHGSKFDIVSGVAVTLPAIVAEPVYEVKIEKGVVYVAIPPEECP